MCSLNLPGRVSIAQFFYQMYAAALSDVVSSRKTLQLQTTAVQNTRDGRWRLGTRFSGRQAPMSVKCPMLFCLSSQLVNHAEIMWVFKWWKRRPHPQFPSVVQRSMCYCYWLASIRRDDSVSRRYNIPSTAYDVLTVLKKDLHVTNPHAGWQSTTETVIII